MENSMELLSAPVTEARLHAALGGAPGYWHQFLINNRRPDRKPRFRIEFEVISGRPFYVEDSVQAFVDFERQRRGVFTTTFSAPNDSAQASGTAESETLNLQALCVCDPSGGRPFVEVRLAGVQRVFRVTPEHSRRVGKLLQQAALVAEQMGDMPE